ncbi:hypothetical protein B0H14DRAFT_3014935 [Mycena olivaceomarginata]|nr:hypothetical protein B0H14DRAFT_3014935 [Mycena olivaceomarginata]
MPMARRMAPRTTELSFYVASHLISGIAFRLLRHLYKLQLGICLWMPGVSSERPWYNVDNMPEIPGPPSLGPAVPDESVCKGLHFDMPTSAGDYVGPTPGSSVINDGVAHCHALPPVTMTQWPLNAQEYVGDGLNEGAEIPGELIVTSTLNEPSVDAAWYSGFDGLFREGATTVTRRLLDSTAKCMSPAPDGPVPATGSDDPNDEMDRISFAEDTNIESGVCQEEITSGGPIGASPVRGNRGSACSPVLNLLIPPTAAIRFFQGFSNTSPTFYRTPETSYEDLCVHHFKTKVIGDADSAIREYWRRDGPTVYVAGADKGRRLGKVVLANPAPFQAVAVAFLTQSHDPVLTRAVWGHGRFIQNNRWTHFQSRFKTVSNEVNDGVDYDLITAPDDTVWLPFQHQLELTLDYNFPKLSPTNFWALITFLSPWMCLAMKNLMVEYVHAILAVLYKLPTDELKIKYLEHQREYLNGLAYVEYVVLTEAKVQTCPQTGEPLHDIYLQALDRIFHLLRTISGSLRSRDPNPEPSSEQVLAAQQFGLTMSRWSICGTCATALYGQQVNMGYMGHINPLRAAVRAAIYPALIPNYMEPEYAIYARQARIATEARQCGKARPGSSASYSNDCYM